MVTKQKKMKKISAGQVKIFKIMNRRGYAAICQNNLTEGSSPFQAYARMEKALKRKGGQLAKIAADKAKKLVRSRI